jgi:Protein of unknown function (DUF2892)
MITNMGVIDGVFRFVLGAALLAWSDHRIGPDLPESLAWAVWVVGAVLAATGLFRFCPVYALLGTDSCAIYPEHDEQPPVSSGLDKSGPSA